MANLAAKEDDTYVIHGPKPQVPLSRDTIGKELYKILINASKDSVAMIDAFTQKKLLYHDLFQQSVNLAVVLRLHGYIGQDTVLSISSENCLNFFVPIIASLFNGSIVAPLNHTYTPYELDHSLNISKPKVVFCSEEIVQKFLDLKSKHPHLQRIIVLGNSSSKVQTLDQFMQGVLKGRNVDVNQFQPVDGDISKMVALILSSSGTTGLPKGVALSHLCLNVRLAHSRDLRYHDQGHENVLGMLPFFHGFGFLIVLSSMANCKTCICLRKFDEDIFLKSIQDYEIHSLPIAPPLAIFLSKTEKLCKYDLSCVKDILCGAAPMSKSTEEEVKTRFRNASLRQGYGLTEMTLAVTIVNQNDVRRGSCGKVMSFISAKVRDPETGRSLGPNKVGELCWKGPCVMMGYYNNEEATRDTFTSDGWLKTGDLGYYDEDGYFYVIDRLKELIKYKGFQVAPAELEAILINHPKIQDVGVVGLPDELVGEQPLAFVVKKNGVDLTEEEVKKCVADLVSPQKRLTGGVIFVDSIPKNPSGKILRRKLRDLLKQYNKTVINSKL